MTRQETIAAITTNARYVLDAASQVESYGDGTFSDVTDTDLATLHDSYNQMKTATEVVRALLFSA